MNFRDPGAGSGHILGLALRRPVINCFLECDLAVLALPRDLTCINLRPVSETVTDRFAHAHIGALLRFGTAPPMLPTGRAFIGAPRPLRFPPISLLCAAVTALTLVLVLFILVIS